MVAAHDVKSPPPRIGTSEKCGSARDSAPITEPNLNDGVRINIRPFMTAGILREQPKGIHWNKDRGTDVPSAPWFNLGRFCGGKSGDRINDHHITLAEKRAAQPLSAE